MHNIMSEERFSQTAWKMSYEQYKKCYCPNCDKTNCPHRDAFRRVPEIDGGLGLCPRLSEKVLFTDADLRKAKAHAYINWENNGPVGFMYEDMWITNPFLDSTGRFELADFNAMCERYGTDNVVAFVKEILGK